MMVSEMSKVTHRANVHAWNGNSELNALSNCAHVTPVRLLQPNITLLPQIDFTVNSV